MEATRREVPQPSGGDERRREWTGGLSQAFETGGQGSYRRQAASAALEALHLHCADEHAAELVEIIRLAGHTGRKNSGWVYVADIQQALPIL